jgi:RNA polymerase sigma-70 factor (ECF subfamily)
LLAAAGEAPEESRTPRHGEARADETLALAAQRGDPRAFDALVDRYAARIHRHILRIVGHVQEAEDLTQETFLKAYRALPRFDSRREFRAWLYTIAANTARTAVRDRGRRAGRWERAQEPKVAVADSAGALLGTEELQERLEGAIQRLNPAAAALIDLYYREGMSVREAAAVAGLSEGAAKVALLRARRQLREWLTGEDTE